MANIDTSIYGNIRPFTMESPIAQAGQALQVQALQQNAQERQRKFQMEDDLSSALTESGGDLGKASTLLASRGRGAASLQLRDKAAADEKAKMEGKLKISEAAASDGVAIDAVWRQTLQKHNGNAQAALAEVQPIWSEVVNKWKGMGHQLPEQFDPQKNLAGVGQAKEMAAYLKSLQPDYGAPVTAVGPDGKPQLFQPNKQGGGKFMGVEPAKLMEPTELARLQAEHDALPDGDPRKAQYARVLAGYKAGKGDTNVSVNMPGPMMPGKPAQKDIDEGIMNTTRNLMQLDTIAGQYKPEYQRFQDKVGFAALKVKDSSVGLTNKEKQDLTEFSQYRRNAFSALNDYIKSVTGAAMSEAEAQRILKGLPNPGSGLFDGDSPTEFKAKLDDAIKQTKMAAARFAYMKRSGLSLEDGLGKGLTLERMPALMNERGKELEAKFKQDQPNVEGKALQKAVRRQLAVEFGLSAD